MRDNTEPSYVHLAEIDRHIHPRGRGYSKIRHGTKSFHGTKHPIVRSSEPGEHRGWCYVDDLPFERL